MELAQQTEEQQRAPQKHGLDAMFSPASVAVIGATSRPGTVGRTVLENLLRDTFRGKVYAVNAKHDEVLGHKVYKSIRDIPQPVDLAVVATPAVTVSPIIAEGAALEQQIKEQLKRSSLRLIGPNCLGIMNPTIGLNATFAKDPPQAGSVAFLSQSGALLSAILDWSHREQVGFSAIVSTGSMLD